MKFLIDNAVSPMLAEGLRAKGHDAVHIRDLGMAAAPDPEVFELATRQERIIISADTDFGTLVAFALSAKPSFILFRQTDKRPASQLRFLLAHLSSLQESLEAGCIVVFEDHRIRVRALPILKS